MPSRKFSSKAPILYGRYSSGHDEWLEAPDSSAIGEAYESGFLPYSGNPEDSRHLFFMARSLRVDLGTFRMEKKRRYNHRQWEAYDLERLHLNKECFLEKHGPEAIDLANKWMGARFGEPYLDPARLAYVMEKPFLNEVLTWSNSGRLVAFAFLASGGWGSHYWFAFYENGTGLDAAPGHGFLVDFLNWARQENRPFAYLGTVYGTHSRYKSRGLQGIEFWDGQQWNREKKELARLRDLDESEAQTPQEISSDASEVLDDSLI